MSEIVTACLSQFHDSENEFELLIGYADGREIGHLVTRENAVQIANGFVTELDIGSEASARIASLSEEKALLRMALQEARGMVAHWGAYASEYFQEKHDLAGDLAELDAALEAP